MTNNTRTTKPLDNWLDKVSRQQGNPKYININAMDDHDPVHWRHRRNRPSADNSYDGDEGREHSEYMRDNGQLALSGGRGIAPWRQIADALPTVESPSIAADMPDTVSTPSKSEVDNG